MRKIGLLAIGIFVFSSPLAAQEPSGGKSMEEMMAAFMKYATPGEHHAKLKPLIGEFVVKSKFRMAPDQEWAESTSAVSGEWVLGDRFLMQKVHSEPDAMMPGGFDGLGFLGYDNLKEKYVLIWMDTTSTGMWTAEGVAEGDQIAFEGRFPDPVSNSEKTLTWTYQMSDDGGVLQRMIEKGADGKMFTSGELRYEREGGK